MEAGETSSNKRAVFSISAQIGDSYGTINSGLEQTGQNVKEDISSRFINKLRQTPCAGFVIAVLSAIFFATASLTVKLVPNVNSFEIVVIRSIIQMIVYLPIIIYNRFNLIGAEEEKIYSLLRGLTGFFSMGLCYTSYRMIPLADASTIVFSSPVYVSVFACIILKEECGFFQIFIIITTMLGVMMVSRPTFIFGSEGDLDTSAASRTGGSLVALGGALAQSMAFVILRKLQRTPSSVVINVYSIVCIVVGVIYLVLIQHVLSEVVPDVAKQGIRVPTEWKEMLLLLANGICGVLGQLCLTVSLKIEEAGIVSLARTTDILMAFIYQLAFLDESAHLVTSIIGALIVATSVCVTGLRRWLAVRPGKWKHLWAILACGKQRVVDG